MSVPRVSICSTSLRLASLAACWLVNPRLVSWAPLLPLVLKYQRVPDAVE